MNKIQKHFQNVTLVGTANETVPTNKTFWKYFVSCSFTFLVVVLATTLFSSEKRYSSINEATAQLEGAAITCSYLVDKGTVPPIKNSDDL